MEEERIIKEYKLFPKQFDAFNFSTRFGAAIAGVQSGKTTSGALWAGEKITRYPGKNGLIAAPTYKLLQQSTLDKFFRIYPNLRRYYKEQKGIIELPTGGTVFIRSADQPLGMEGMTVSWVWLDEAGQMPKLAWTVAKSRVSMTGGQIFITTTPYSLNWLYQDFYLPWKCGTDKDLSVFTWRSIDNPYFPKDFAEGEKRRLRPEEYARRYEGEFTKMEGLVYDLPQDRIIAPIFNLKERAEFRGMGVDWGFTNPAAILVMYLYDGKWYAVDEWKEPERTTAQIIKVIDGKIKEHRIDMVFPDPAEPDRIKEMQDAGLTQFIGEANKDIRGGVSHIQQLIRENKLVAYNTCLNFLDEINSYHYPEGQEGKPFKEEPVKFNDHLMDAMRYLIFSYRPGGYRQVLVQSGGVEPLYPGMPG